MPLTQSQASGVPKVVIPEDSDLHSTPRMNDPDIGITMGGLLLCHVKNVGKNAKINNSSILGPNNMSKAIAAIYILINLQQ